MTAPTIGTVTFDKPLYNSGDVVQMTVAYTPGTSTPPPPATETVDVTGTGTDSASGESATFTATYDVAAAAPAPVTDATTWVISDSHGGHWTQVSDNGAEAVFTSVA